MLRWNLLTPGAKEIQHLEWVSLLSSFHFNAKVNCISTGPRLHITTHLQAECEADGSKGEQHKRKPSQDGKQKWTNTFKCSVAQHIHKQACSINAKQVYVINHLWSYDSMIRSLGLLGDNLVSPMAASQLAFLCKCHFRSYQKPGTTLSAHLCSHEVPWACTLPSLQRFPRVPCSSVTIMSTSSELINWV